jgi:hypothetical protein
MLSQIRANSQSFSFPYELAAETVKNNFSVSWISIQYALDSVLFLMSISASVEHSIPGPVFVAVYRVMKTVENGDADRLCSYLELAKLGKAAAFPAPLLSSHRELALFRFGRLQVARHG